MLLFIFKTVINLLSASLTQIYFMAWWKDLLPQSSPFVKSEISVATLSCPFAPVRQKLLPPLDLPCILYFRV